MKKLLYFLMLLVTLSVAAMTPEARRSFHAFEQRAENGDPEAQYRLSILLEQGFDTIPADTIRSISMLRRSARAGYAPAMNYLGYLYQYGFPSAPASDQFILQNTDSAQYYLHRAAVAGDPKAAHNLAYLLLNPSASGQETDDENGWFGQKEKSDSLAVNYLTQAAEAGLPQSQTLLADLCVQGRGLAPDTLRAITLYEKAIAAGFHDAELRLLNMIGHKFDTLEPYDALSEAVRYWKTGAYAISTAILLHLTSTMPPDATAAITCKSDSVAIRAAYILGRAYALLGHACSHGQGVQYDHRRANEYFARAAMLGDPSAQFILAETLEIFPDALASLFPNLSYEQAESLTPQRLRENAANSGITTAEAATRALLTL